MHQNGTTLLWKIVASISLLKQTWDLGYNFGWMHPNSTTILWEMIASKFKANLGHGIFLDGFTQMTRLFCGE